MLANTKIGNNVQISPLAVIGENVEIGDNTVIKEFVVIRDNVKIGSDNVIYPHVTIGEDPQDRSFGAEKSFVEIGNNNVIRENVTIHKAVGVDQVTKLGDNNFLMVGVHLAHNVEVGNNNTIANNVSLAGHSIVGDYITFGGAAQIHQHCHIGDYAMISGLAGINYDVVPFMIYGDIPAKAVTTNRIALKKHAFSQQERSEVMMAFRTIYETNLSVASIITELEALPESRVINKILEFIKNSKRGIITQKYSKHNG